MSVAAAIPRVSLGWLLLAQALVLLPLWFHVPLWMLGLWLGCTVWRVQIFRMRVGHPGRVLKALLMLLTAGGVYLSSDSVFSLDATAALLVAAANLKMLEMRSSRDARVLVLLGLFSVAVGYLFDASLPWALYSLLPIATLLAALIGLQQAALIAKPLATLRLALAMLGQALPLMLVLFVFFPRLEPFWSLPLPSANQARTGLDDSMSVADITQLGRSTEVAFRASFDGPIPPKRELYWRALTLGRYDGRTWSQSPQVDVQPAPAWQPQGPAYTYRVVQQPSGKPWLFALDVARTDLPNVRQLSDFRLQRRRPVDQPLLYAVSSWPQASREPQLSEASRRQALQLPASGEPRSREWGRQLRAQYADPQALVQAMLNDFRQQQFHYTLNPPALGRDSIDEFLFDSRRGFCAHYAGAMVFVLRAAGVPARMVVGYLGGEVNPAGEFLTVRQFEAHAWVEYWQAGVGWRSVDPTGAVAPQRVEQGLEQALAADEGFLDDSLFSPLRYRNLAWLNGLRLEWDNLNYGWQRWVLGYQGQQQTSFLKRWFQGLEQVVLPVAGVLLLGLLALLLLKPWQHRADPRLRQFRAFEKLLRRHGLLLQSGEGPNAFAARAALQLPAQAPSIEAFARAFSASRYADDHAAGALLDEHLKSLRRDLRRVRTTALKE